MPATAAWVGPLEICAPIGRSQARHSESSLTRTSSVSLEYLEFVFLFVSGMCAVFVVLGPVMFAWSPRGIMYALGSTRDSRCTSTLEVEKETRALTFNHPEARTAGYTSRLLEVHLTGTLPCGAAEARVAQAYPLIQTAALFCKWYA